MWVKPPAAICFYLPLIRNFFYNVLVQSFTSTQAATCRELQPSLSFSSFSWKGATTPLALALAKILVRRCWPTEGYNLLFLPGTTFHKFSDWIHEHQSIIKNFCIKQSPFHQLALNQVDTSLTAVFQIKVTVTTHQI